MKPDIKIFSGSSGMDFAQKIGRYLGVPVAPSEVFKFSEGNTFVRVKESVRGEDVYIVQSIGMNPNNEFVEILFWIDAFKRASARSVTVIMPFFSYAKGDKKDEPRVSIRAKVCADCIEVTGADRVVTMDLHSPQIQGFFKKPVDHLTTKPLFAEVIKRMNLENYVIVSPDVGFAKEARWLSKKLGVPTVIGDKTRVDHTEQAEILELIGEVKGKNAVIVDDFSISGGTLIDLAHTLKARGALRIFAFLSHVMLNEKGLARLEESPIEQLICTDTVDNPFAKASAKVKIISVAPLFAETMKRIHARASVSVMYDVIPREVLDEIDLLSL